MPVDGKLQQAGVWVPVLLRLNNCLENPTVDLNPPEVASEAGSRDPNTSLPKRRKTTLLSQSVTRLGMVGGSPGHRIFWGRILPPSFCRCHMPASQRNCGTTDAREQPAAQSKVRMMPGWPEREKAQSLHPPRPWAPACPDHPSA